MRSEENVPRIIDDLYAGALDHVAWDRAMIAMADLVSGTGTLLFGLNPTNASILRDEIHRFDPLAVAEYRKYWIAKDVRFEPLLRLPIGEAGFESKLLPIRHLLSSEIYNEYLVRVDSPSFLVFWLHKAADKVVVLSIQGTRQRGPFDDRDGERIGPLLPHLRRALEIKDRLEIAQIRNDTLATSLDSLSFGVLILDVDGHVLEASTSASELLRSDCGIRRNPDGTLWLREPAGTELNQWVFKGTPPANNSAGLLHVPRPLARPLSVMVTRLPEMSTSWFSGGPPCWMLLLFDPDRQLQTSTELIARELGISAREGEIAALLVSGYNLSSIAQRLHISIHTARTHLKAIFAKTGICSQVELIRRIASGPAAVAVTNGR